MNRFWRGVWIASLVVVALPLLYGATYWTLTRLPFFDALTMRLPQGVRDWVSDDLALREVLGKGNLAAGERAIRISPESENVWSSYCIDLPDHSHDATRAMDVCKRAEALILKRGYSVDAEMVADSFARLNHRCDGLKLMARAQREDKGNMFLEGELGVLEALCGQSENSERHLRDAVWKTQADDRTWHHVDRPPSNADPKNSYETSSREYLSNARMNLSALLLTEGKSAEATDVCRAAISPAAAQCICKFTGERILHLAACSASATE